MWRTQKDGVYIKIDHRLCLVMNGDGSPVLFMHNFQGPLQVPVGNRIYILVSPLPHLATPLHLLGSTLPLLVTPLVPAENWTGWWEARISLPPSLAEQQLKQRRSRQAGRSDLLSSCSIIGQPTLSPSGLNGMEEKWCRLVGSSSPPALVLSGAAATGRAEQASGNW